MSDYLYVTLACVLFICLIINEIYTFKKGKYVPCLNRSNEDSFKKRAFDAGVFIAIWFSIRNIDHDFTLPAYFILVLISIPICMNVLAYLSYLKTRDRKFIYHIAIIDTFLISLFLYATI